MKCEQPNTQFASGGPQDTLKLGDAFPIGSCRKMLEGTVQNGVVVLPPGVTLPEGSVVNIVPQAPAVKEACVPGNIWDDLIALAKQVESLPCDLPEDLAINHDHYLYGAPKRQ